METTKEFKKLIVKLDFIKDEIIEEMKEMINIRKEFSEEKSEKWQEGERGQEFENATDDLDNQIPEFHYNILECLSTLNSIEDI